MFKNHFAFKNVLFESLFLKNKRKITSFSVNPFVFLKANDIFKTNTIFLK